MKKKWLTLGLVGTALLLIPRRSSRQMSATKQNHLPPHNQNKPPLRTTDIKEKDA